MLSFYNLPFPEPFDELELDHQLLFIRSYRDRLLKDSDWTQTVDSPVDKVKWAEYRQALRDIPQNWVRGTPVVFPDPPGGE